MIPILFEAGFISIQTLWVFVALAMITGSAMAIKHLKRARLDFTILIKYSSGFFISALILSRIVFFMTHFDRYFPALDLRTLKNFFAIWDKGFSFWGALLGFGAAMTYRLKKSGESFWKWTDALSLPFLTALAIMLLGAFLGGYVYGTPSKLPWAVRYETFNVRYTVPIHPVQIYYIIAIFSAIRIRKEIKKRNNFFDKDGNTTLFFSSIFFFIAFFFEFIRGDATILILKWRLPIFIYATLLIASCSLLFKRIRAYKISLNK